MTFNLQEHDSEKRHTKHKHCAPLKSSLAARHSSTKRTRSTPSETFNSKAKPLSLLKAGPQPAPYSYFIKNTPINKKHSTTFMRQENSVDSVVLSLKVRRPEVQKSTSHHVSHTLLSRDDRKELIISNNNQRTTYSVNTFSNKATTLETRNFTLQYKYSAVHNYSVKNTEKKLNTPVKVSSPDKLSGEKTRGRNLSLCCTPRKYSTSSQKELLLENCNNMNHHANLFSESMSHSRNHSLPTPEHAHAYLLTNAPSASKHLLSITPSHTHPFPEHKAEIENFSMQHAKNPFSHSATCTPVPGPANHPSKLLPNDPSKNLTVLKSLSSPLTYRGTASHTPNTSEIPKQLSVPQNPGVTPRSSRPTHLRVERTPHSAHRSSAGEEKTRPSVRRPQGCLDPVSSFMMLRGVLGLPVEKRPEATPLHTTGKQTV